MGIFFVSLQLPQDLSLKASQRSACNSVLRIPSSTQSSPNTFFTSTKMNFKVTSCREDSPLIAYNTPPWFPCLFNFQKVTDKEPSSTSPSPALTSSPTSQASVIAKAVDLSVAKHKTLQWRYFNLTTRCCLTDIPTTHYSALIKYSQVQDFPQISCIRVQLLKPNRVPRYLIQLYYYISKIFCNTLPHSHNSVKYVTCITTSQMWHLITEVVSVR